MAGVTVPASARAAESKPDLTAEQKASQEARATGKPVAVPSLLSETTQVVANPDGTFTAEVHAGPVRYRAEDGAWAAVDLTLVRRSDGSVAPKGHPRGLVLSGAAAAGDHDLARLKWGQVNLAVGWTGVLPEPELDGTTATYRGVRPGVDLVVDATRTGFEQYLVVQDRAAAAQVKTISLPWRTAGVTPSVRPDGALQLRDDNGRYVGHMPAPVMWDATVGQESGDHLRAAPVRMTVAAGASILTLTPSQAFLSDPATRYPVTIDPSPTLRPGFDTLVQDNISSDLSTSKELKLGSVTEGGTYRARSFIRWPVAVTAGKRVTAATLYLWNTHSWNCDPQEWQVWMTSAVGTSTRWSNQPGWGSSYPIAKSTMTKGYSGCTPGFITANVQPLFQKASDLGYTALTTGLRAKQSDEDDPSQHSWKKFESTEATHDPYVAITYNSKPYAPTGVTIGGKACGNSDPAAYVSKAAGYPSAQANGVDPDGTERLLKMQFYVLKWGTALPDKYTMRVDMDHGTATVAIPSTFGLVENQKYTMYAELFDGLDYSPPSAGCTFTIDSTGPPRPPTVTSTDYPPCKADPACTRGGVGVAGRFDLGPNGVADILQYRYWFDGGAKMTTAVSQGGSATVDITPPPPGTAAKLSGLKLGGPRTLHVVSVDQAGRESSEFTVGAGDASVGGYRFEVASAPDESGWWKLEEPTGSTTAADSVSGGHPLTVSGGWGSAAGSGDGGTGYSFDATGLAQGGLAAGLSGNRTTVATARLSSSSAAEFTIVRHVDYPVGATSGRQDDLYFDGAAQKVCYRARVDSQEWKACSTQTVRVGVWVRVAGSFDTMRREASVYVDGARTASTAVTAYTGPSIGNGVSTTIAGKSLIGAVDDVRVWNRVLAPQEVAAASIIEAGYWDFDFWDGADTTTHRLHHDVSTATPPVDLWSDVGHNNSDLGSAELDGATTLSTSGAVLNTAESFSVSAWVSLHTVPTTNLTAVSQDGSYQSNFFLGVRIVSGTPRWSFSMQDADSTAAVSGTHTYTTTPIAADDIGAFVHLVGVYDAVTQQQVLYVDGTSTLPVPRTARWPAIGPLNIGARSTAANGAKVLTDFLPGGVDEVRVYAGALTPDLAMRLYQTEDGTL